MKIKSIRIWIAGALCVALCGCSAAQTTGVARYVEPLENGGETVLPAQAPSTAQGKKSFVANTASLSATAFTPDATWQVRENYFIHEEFYFIIPAAWLNNFKFETNVTEVKGYTNRQFDFYYTEGDTSVKLMQIECVQRGLLEELEFYNSKDKLGESADGNYVYFITYYDMTVPQDASYTSTCINILSTMMTDRGKITLTV